MSSHIHRHHSWARLRIRAGEVIRALDLTTEALKALDPSKLHPCDAVVVYSARIWLRDKGETYPERLRLAIKRISEEAKS